MLFLKVDTSLIAYFGLMCNLLDTKYVDGNVAIKFDVAKAFDTLN